MPRVNFVLELMYFPRLGGHLWLEVCRDETQLWNPGFLNRNEILAHLFLIVLFFFPPFLLLLMLVFFLIAFSI